VFKNRVLRVFKNRVLRKTVGPMREEVIRYWRKLNDEELHDFYSDFSLGIKEIFALLGCYSVEIGKYLPIHTV
jgi:hypothetical protein